MFNAWRFNGAPFAGSARTARVLFAASTFAALATVSGAAVADRAGASALDGWAGVEPTVMAYRAGGAHGHVLATFEPGRPWDLAGSGLAGLTEAEADGFRIGAGVAYLDATAAFEPSEVIYNTTALLDAGALAEPGAYTIAKGVAALPVEAGLEGAPWRIRNARADALAPAVLGADAFVYRDGAGDLSAHSDTDAYALINGRHEAFPEITAHASMSANGTREARSPVEADVQAVFHAEPVPWLGSQVQGAATAEMFATWWTYIQTYAQIEAGSSRLEAAPMVDHAGAAQLDAQATGEAIWSRRVEPSLVFAESIAFADIVGWRVRPETADHRVFGTLDALGYRVSFRESTFDARAAVEPRAFVNFTHDAPDWRSMTVPAERRAMVVPYENRMMVVR